MLQDALVEWLELRQRHGKHHQSPKDEEYKYY